MNSHEMFNPYVVFSSIVFFLIFILQFFNFDKVQKYSFYFNMCITSLIVSYFIEKQIYFDKDTLEILFIISSFFLTISTYLNKRKIILVSLNNFIFISNYYLILLLEFNNIYINMFFSILILITYMSFFTYLSKI